jgi:2-methylisocitrate lyase-like PEP mutase family enzyme
VTRSSRFRELIKSPPLICMGAFDAVTAKLAEQAGAKCIFVSGFTASAVLAGAPDFGVLSQTEMFEHIRRISRVTSIPIFADADTGYGGPLEARRTMQLWEEAGASVLHLEDQVQPKKCGHFAGKELISAEEMQQKLRAMLEVRKDPDFFIVARTDAIAVTGIDDAIARLKMYAEIGADGLYADAPESIEQMVRIGKELKPLGKPILFNMVPSGKSPRLSLQESHELGFDFVLSPVEPLLAMHKAVKTMMETFLANPTPDAIADSLTTFDDLNNFLGLPDMLGLMNRYGADAKRSETV